MTKTRKELPSPELLRKLLRYEPETGKLFWKFRPLEMFADETHGKIWNSRFAEKQAFCSIDKDGYAYGSILSCSLRAHRVAWALHYGEHPKAFIDHANRNRLDNRIDNLRDATKSQNAVNSRLRSDNTSGFRGVSWSKAMNKWACEICVNGDRLRLGFYDCPKEAAKVYRLASLKAFGEFSATPGNEEPPF